MRFHEDEDFHQLLGIVARDTGIAAALVEKDYWVTHSLWALHQTGLDVWFKGGTSLSKGFKLIHRFSEDLDLKVLHGAMTGLPPVTNWTSTRKGAITKRRAFYDALVDAIIVPDVRVEKDPVRLDTRARSGDYIGYYPGTLISQLAPTMSPFVRFEVGSARVVPCVETPLSSFVHDYLDEQGLMKDFRDNRPEAVRCVHPLVTLLEKLDALSRRYSCQEMKPDSFIRHYEDAAQIIQAEHRLPALTMTPIELARDMLASKDIVGLPRPHDPAWLLEDTTKREQVEEAHRTIAPMFWGPRRPLKEACDDIQRWVHQLMAS